MARARVVEFVPAVEAGLVRPMDRELARAGEAESEAAPRGWVVASQLLELSSRPIPSSPKKLVKPSSRVRWRCSVVGTDGRTHDVRIIRSLGRGLDEKALEAIGQWRFETQTQGRKSGRRTSKCGSEFSTPLNNHNAGH